jgi:hypothetical protein
MVILNKERPMAELKTKRNNQSVKAFLDSITDERKRQDAFAILDLMQQASKAEPQMWGSSIIGFGSYHYRYASGREGDWPISGFSPRKQNLTLYIMHGFDSFGGLLGKLGKYKTGKACLYINRLDDVHLPTLKELISQSVKHMANSAK